ncbi:hypothetical protein RRG08_024571 [Elysia crispata]|uniref:Uncharacterized protein n=1 Tax=Elysia crispata TaxID=231223 RepID=A0AAE0ZWH1_9GAST|nr:hypothetical protein RRG08_024571 [Elysia crispata]
MQSRRPSDFLPAEQTSQQANQSKARAAQGSMDGRCKQGQVHKSFISEKTHCRSNRSGGLGLKEYRTKHSMLILCTTRQCLEELSSSIRHRQQKLDHFESNVHIRKLRIQEH